MTTSNDFIRQASRATTGGLIDPRLMPGYESTSTNLPSSRMSIFEIVKRIPETILNKFVKRQPQV